MKLYRACDCYAKYCKHNPADYSKLKIRDIVKATDNGHPLRCGSGTYDNAVVISVNPLVMVSPSGDMRWSHFYGPLDRVGVKASYFTFLKLKYKRGKK